MGSGRGSEGHFNIGRGSERASMASLLRPRTTAPILVGAIHWLLRGKDGGKPTEPPRVDHLRFLMATHNSPICRPNPRGPLAWPSNSIQPSPTSLSRQLHPRKEGIRISAQSSAVQGEARGKKTFGVKTRAIKSMALTTRRQGGSEQERGNHFTTTSPSL